MLKVFCADGGGLIDAMPISPLPVGPWVDLFSPTPEETARLEAETGLSIASRDQLAEIESSSRLSERDGVLYLSVPVVSIDADGLAVSSQVGVVLSERRLVTIRFTEMPGFASQVSNLTNLPEQSPAAVFVGLLEGLVDRTADQLERVRDEMDATANRIFVRHSGARGPSQDNRELREALQKISLTGDYVSRVHDTLLVLGRIVGYVSAVGPDWFPAALRKRVKTLRQDVASLRDFDAHLSEKVHFQLDAILGFVNIAQNHIIKVLAVVGTVGVPPTLIASIYGMNFEAMPELRAAWGYPIAMCAIAASALIPLLWFKRRGWL
ncbi:MAG TPA: magnesium transporter CorA family protein [Acetobacteraceae bacterium]|jgi:magnesium transporter